MSERRMDAYYYDFEPTNNAAIDKILGAVACAGKAYHHTQDWCEKTSPYDDHTGVTPAEWIQNAAIEAADEIERLRAALGPFALLAGVVVPDDADETTVIGVTVGALRRARRALAAAPKENSND